MSTTRTRFLSPGLPGLLGPLGPLGLACLLVLPATRAAAGPAPAGAHDDLFAQRAWAVGSDPRDLALADLDGDGALDLVVVNHGDHTVSVLLGDGAGAFVDAATYPAGNGADDVEIGDLDGDDLPDLVVSNEDSNNVSILLGKGDGSFWPTLNLPTFGDVPMDVGLGDFDEDGVLDAAVVNREQGETSILHGTGNGLLTLAQTLIVVHSPQAVAAGDVTGNGHTDLVFCTLEGPTPAYTTLRVSVGLGTGSFSTPLDLSLLHGLDQPVLGDLDGDRVADIVCASRSHARVVSVLGNGAGGFEAAVPVATADIPLSVALVDLDGDDDLDVLGGGLDNRMELLNDGAGVLTLTTEVASSDTLAHLRAADLDDDGLPDMVTVGNLGQIASNASQAAVWRRRADGGYGVLNSGGGVSPDFARGLDFDGDGDGDLVMAEDLSTQTRLYVRRNDGGEVFTDLGFVSYPGVVKDLAVADLDADGLPDVVVLHDGNPEGLTTLLGQGDGTFAAPVTVEFGEVPTHLALADVDGDGVLDAVVSEGSSNQPVFGVLSVLLGDGSGGFAAPIPTPWPGTGAALALGDLDGDGHLDAAAGSFTGALEVALGDGAGAFGPPQSFPLPAAARDIALADLDRDGALDLAAVHGALSILPGDGAGGFGPAVTHVLPEELDITLAVADIDLDCFPDVVVGGRSLGLFVLRGLGDLGFDAPHNQLGPVKGFLTPMGAELFDFDGDGRLDLLSWSDTNTSRAKVQLNIAELPWTRLPGTALVGTHGEPRLDGCGSLHAGDPVELALTDALPGAASWLVVGAAAVELPFYGGTLVPAFEAPLGMVLSLPTDADGGWTLGGPWLAGVPADTSLWFQAWVADPGGPFGLSASNALRAVTP